MKKSFALIFLFPFISLAEVNYGVDAALRTDPRAKNLTARIAYDHLLHGKASKETPLYGYVRVGAVVGGSPTMAGFLQIAPVAPLIFEVQKSRTLRFENTDRFDCKTYECQGQVDRTDYGVRAIVAYQKFFLSPSFMWREIQTDPNSRSIYLEHEVFVASPGFHRFTQASAILGYLITANEQAGLMYTSNEISETQARSRTASAFYRFKLSDFVITAGLSHYKYEQFNIEGPGGFLTIGLNFGEKLSLF